ncbi:MAG: glycoside hydrolase family 127 protein [Streptosporangiaceae bacterium]
MSQTSGRPGLAAAGPVAPVATERLTLRPIRGGGVRIEGGFWGRFQVLNRETTIPHGMHMLEETGSLENLRIAAGLTSGEYSMPLFRDSDVYKVLEAIGWERAHGADPEQDQFLTDTAGLLARAQQPDGYLNSYVQVVESGKRFGNPAMGHELYCAGHLMQAAVADLRTGGDPDGLAAVARRFADLLAGPDLPDGFVPGHPEIEMALVELYRTAGSGKYLDLAADLVARRGRSTLHWGSVGQVYEPAYFQDDVPFEQAEEVRGHSVRALYLLSGATDLYLETGRPGLLRSALAQWDDMVSAKTYLTGGIGSRHKREAFGDPFELPPDRAYCETCAAIASIMWNWRMLLATGEVRFADLLERTLYNGFLAGLGFDGKTFFYVNPLHTRSPRERERWHQCACCPPNIMRLVASLDYYIATSTDTGLQIHQFASGRVAADLTSGTFAIEMATGYPDQGTLRLRLRRAPGGPAELAIRVPGWAAEASVTLNGRPAQAEPGTDHYLRISRTWAEGDELDVEFPLQVRTIYPRPDIDAVRSCVAYERGPLVYCFEGVDVAGVGRLRGATVRQGAKPSEIPDADVAGHRVTGLCVPGQITARSPDGWPYLDHPPGGADGTGGRPARDIELRAIPYYAWANRGPGDMRVWIPEHPGAGEGMGHDGPAS